MVIIYVNGANISQIEIIINRTTVKTKVDSPEGRPYTKKLNTYNCSNPEPFKLHDSQINYKVIFFHVTYFQIYQAVI